MARNLAFAGTAQIAVADFFHGQYRNAATMAAQLVGAVQLEMKRARWTGARIIYAARGPINDDGREWLVFRVGPGHGRLDVETLEAAIKDQAERAAKAREQENGTA